ncbi:MAG: HEAT repeat domain-containing protein [Candidatus Cloacimonetes bacterium]|nr:HEAT repeat domain-containing protein [Candidatus Cloacimonadota bacterium]
MGFELTESEQYDLFYELAKSLSHPSRDVRVSTVSAISRIANRRCTNLLLDKLDLEKDIFIKASLIRILGEIGTPNLIDALEKYQIHAEPRIRANAIESLVKLQVKNKEELVKRIVPCVHDENNRVSSTALKELLSLGETRFVPYLKLLLKGTDANRKSSAIWVVGELGLDAFVEDVVFSLYSENYQVHSIAERVLIRFKDKAIPLLFENLVMGDSMVKVYTFLFLSKHLNDMTDEQNKMLFDFIEVESDFIVAFVLQILYKFKSKDAFNLMKSYLFAEDEGLRRVSIEGIRHFIDQEGVNDLVVKAIQSEKDPRLLANLIQCLNSFPQSISEDLLKDFVNHEDDRVCANAIELFGNRGDEKLLSFIVPHVESSNNRIMANAAIACFRLGEKKVLNHLKKALSSSNVKMRASAAFALGEIGSSDVVEILIERLLEDVQSVRKHIINGLMQQDKGVYQRLIGILKDSNSLKSREVLAEITHQVNTPQEQIQKLLEYYSDEVSAFEIPENMSEEEIDEVIELLFCNDHRLKTYGIFIMGEKKIYKSVSRLICLLYERNDEVVGETLLALEKLNKEETLVFLRDVYAWMNNENIDLCAKVMQHFAKGQLDSSYFSSSLKPKHLNCLERYKVSA